MSRENSQEAKKMITDPRLTAPASDKGPSTGSGKSIFLLGAAPGANMRAAGAGKKAAPLFRQHGQRPNQVPFIDVKKLQRGEELACTPSFVEPFVMQHDPKDKSSKAEPHVYQGLDIIRLQHQINPVLVFGQPYIGKTTLFLKMMNKAKEHYGAKHWVALVDMARLVPLVRAHRPKSFLQLLALHLEISEKQLKEMFRVQSRRKAYTGDLFLDGFDEIPKVDREYFWKIIPLLKYKEGQCAVRIWISCRTYLRYHLNKVFPDSTSFDLLTYNVHQQIDLLNNIWKNEFFPKLKKGEEKDTLEFTKYLYAHLQVLIPNFDQTLGSLPVIFEVLANIYCPHLDVYLKRKKGQHLGNIFNEEHAIRVTDLIESLVESLIERYLFKTGNFNKYDPSLTDKELSNIIKLHVEFAIKCYPYYICDGKEIKIPVDELLYKIGFLIKDENRCTRFHHTFIGDYLLGKFFAGTGTLDAGSTYIDRFFLRTVLFEKDAIGILSYFDCSIQSQLDKLYRSKLIHDFLIKHYKLGPGQDAEWKKIKDYGNIWHLAIFQGFHRTAQFLLNAFQPNEQQEMKKFLMMRCPMHTIEANHVEVIDGQASFVNHRLLLSSLSMLALFGYGKHLEEAFNQFMSVFQTKEIQAEFNRQGEWSPIHFAAIHNNLWFYMQVWDTDFCKKIKLQPGIRNPCGLLPTHLLMLSFWRHTLTIRDCNLEDYPNRGSLDTTDNKGATTSNKGKASQGKDKENKEKFVTSDDVGFRLLIRDTQVDLDVVNDYLLTAVHIACIERLLTNGRENVDGVDSTNKLTMLFYAAQEGLLGVTRYLLCMGANINFKNSANGMSCLHWAAFNGHKNVFMCLLKRGAKLNVQDSNGITPITLWNQLGLKKYYENGGPELTMEEKSFFLTCSDLDKLMAEKRMNGQEDDDDSESGSDEERYSSAESESSRQGTGAEADDDGEDGYDDKIAVSATSTSTQGCHQSPQVVTHTIERYVLLDSNGGTPLLYKKSCGK